MDKLEMENEFYNITDFDMIDAKTTIIHFWPSSID